MSHEPLRHVQGIAAPLLRDSIDTDVIAPSRLTVPGLGKDGYEAILFGNWRFTPEGQERSDFVLNQAEFRNAKILVTGANFGCGSSRETAAWALRGFGIQAVIAPSFGTIFESNCYHNAVLPLPLPPAEHRCLVEELFDGGSPTEAEIDLDSCKVRAANNQWHSFTLDERGRQLLRAGLDEIDETLEHRDAVERFREHDRQRHPWLYRRIEL